MLRLSTHPNLPPPPPQDLPSHNPPPLPSEDTTPAPQVNLPPAIETLITTTVVESIPSPSPVPADIPASDVVITDAPSTESQPPPPPPATTEPPPAMSSDNSSDDGSHSDSEDEPRPCHWMDLSDDPSAPDARELREIEASEERSAHDHHYYEEMTYQNLTDREFRAGAAGQIDWTIKKFNGSREDPNREVIMRSDPVPIGGHIWRIKMFPRGNDTEQVSIYIECSSLLDPDEQSKSAGRAPASQTAPSPGRRSSKRLPGSGAVVADPSNQKAMASSSLTKRILQTPIPLLKGKTIDVRPTVNAQISLVLYNPDEPRTNQWRNASHKFCPKNADWGWTRFAGPWYELGRRRRGQRQALIRKDRVAMRAYIRIIEDDTECLWEHSTATNPYSSLSMVGLQPLQSGMDNNGTFIASTLATWMLFRPFRELLYRHNIDADGKSERDLQKQRLTPMLDGLQRVLYRLRDGSQDLAPVSIEPVTTALQYYGVDHVSSCSDTVAMAEQMYLKMEAELQGTDLLPKLRAIFNSAGWAGDKTQLIPRVQIKGHANVQAATNAALKNAKKITTPWLLQIELKRHDFDHTTRKWEKIKQNIELEEELTVSGVKYRLFGFVSMRGELRSGVAQPVIRPCGPGSKWFTYECGRYQAKVTCFTQREMKQAVGEADRDNTMLAHVVSYVREDIAEHAFGISLETDWDLPEVSREASKLSKSTLVNSPGEHTDGASPMEDVKQPAPPLYFDIFDSRGFLGREGIGFFLASDLDQQKAKFAKRVLINPEASVAEIQVKLAEALPDIKDPRQVVPFLMGFKGCNEARPFLIELEENFSLEEALSEIDSREHEEKMPLLSRDSLEGGTIWVYVAPHASLSPEPKPLAAAPTAAVASQTADHAMTTGDDAGEGSSVPGSGSDRTGDGSASPPDSLMSSHALSPVSPTTNAIPSNLVPVFGSMPPGIMPNIDLFAAQNMIAAAQSVGMAPGAGTNIPAATELVQQQQLGPRPTPKIYFLLKIFDVEKQTLTMHSSHLVNEEARIDHEIQKALRLPKENTIKSCIEKSNTLAIPTRKRRLFADEIAQDEEYIIVVAQINPPEGEAAAPLTAKGHILDFPEYLRQRTLLRNSPCLANGETIIDYMHTSFYAGALVNGYPHGPGTKIYPNGDTYTGAFHSDKRHGHGLMIYSNGDQYTGDWIDDLRDGHGQLIESESGNTYTGGWSKNKRHGEGITHWKKAENQEGVCRICYFEGADAAFVPCGHVVACFGCARQVESCPYCRVGAERAVRIFNVA